MERRNTLLYPLMVIAAISVTAFSMLGIAAMTGHLPDAFSQKPEPGVAEPRRVQSGSGPDRPGGPAAGTERPGPGGETRFAASVACAECGVVQSVRRVEVNGSGTGLGAVAGGVAGGVLGNQIGHGGGRTAATLLGAAGGAYAGHEIEKSARKSAAFEVTVRMDDGRLRIVTRKIDPGVGVGQRVRVVDGEVVTTG